MNLITNNCLGGFLYRDFLKSRYENPFIWTSLDINEYIKLVDNYETINFQNVMIDKYGDGLSNNFLILIDDKIKVKNIHVHFSANDNVPRNNGEIYYNKPWEYIYNKYNERVTRMNNTCLRFIYFSHARYNNTIEKLQELANTFVKHKFKAIIFSDKYFNYTNNDFCKVFVHNIAEDTHWNENCIVLYKNVLKEFLT